MTIGEKIRMLRKKFKMSQKELAQKAHISETALINYEKNRRIPPMDIIKNLCVALNNISPEYLVFGESYNFWVGMEKITDKYFIEELNKFRSIKFNGSEAEASKEQQIFLEFLSKNNLYYALPSKNINIQENYKKLLEAQNDTIFTPKQLNKSLSISELILKNPYFVMVIPDENNIENNVIFNIDDIIKFNEEINNYAQYIFYKALKDKNKKGGE